MYDIHSLATKFHLPKWVLTAVEKSFDSEDYFHNYTLCCRSASNLIKLREELFCPSLSDRHYFLAAFLAFAHHSQGKMAYADDLAFSIRFTTEVLTKLKEDDRTIQEVIRLISLMDAPQNTKLSYQDQLFVAAGSMDFMYPDWYSRFVAWEKESCRKQNRTFNQHEVLRKVVAKLDNRMPFWPAVVKAKYLLWRTQLTEQKQQYIGFE